MASSQNLVWLYSISSPASEKNQFAKCAERKVMRKAEQEKKNYHKRHRKTRWDKGWIGQQTDGDSVQIDICAFHWVFVCSGRSTKPQGITKGEIFSNKRKMAHVYTVKHFKLVPIANLVPKAALKTGVNSNRGSLFQLKTKFIKSL